MERDEREKLHKETLDYLILEKYRAMKEIGTKITAEQHPIIYAFLSTLLKGRKGKIGLQIADQGKIIGNYTIFMDGLHIEKIEPDMLEPEIHIPLWGTIRPYSIAERSDMEAILNDHTILSGDIFKNAGKYFPMITIKFKK